MKMYYLVYLPSLKVMHVSQEMADCDAVYKKIGHDYDEDYKVMSDSEFVEMVRQSGSVNKSLHEALMACVVMEKNQFGEPCWCRTIAGLYCVGQDQCKKAKLALKKLEESSHGG